MLAAIAPLFTDIRFSDRADVWHTDVLHQLLSQVDANLESPDAGLWEKRQAPAVHTFSVLMHWAGATAAQHVGDALRDDELANRGKDLASRARGLIETRCWRAELGYFADTVDSNHPDASLLLMVNLGFIAPDSERARSHVENLATALSANDHLLFRYLHDDGIGETHATFTVCGFWYAEALARIGRRADAERVFTSLLRHANHVGLLSEDIDPRTGQMWGNLPQTYSHVGVINTAFALSQSSPRLL
jgi:GH15 family glucan-1,4-alpha-glucosidase